jgi:hypothetical protein
LMCKTHGASFSFYTEFVKLFPFLSYKACKVFLFLVV